MSNDNTPRSHVTTGCWVVNAIFHEAGTLIGESGQKVVRLHVLLVKQI